VSLLSKSTMSFVISVSLSFINNIYSPQVHASKKHIPSLVLIISKRFFSHLLAHYNSIVLEKVQWYI